ncbi:MAG: hypothetical protein JXR63_03905 [Spirochaetales bacterium]|nr:hypothetical protein [Spirochaetales bacterium]
MEKSKPPQLYKQYFIDKNDERKTLFEKLVKLFPIKKGIYPGSFVHITPSFFIPEMTYIDADKRISKFFEETTLLSYIEENKHYKESPSVRGIQADYSTNLPIEKASFDIMFSFYAGFISQSCKNFLKKNAILVCNNSHGDASLAAIDPDYKLIGVITFNDQEYQISQEELTSFFIKKDGSSIDKEKVKRTMTGEKFTKTPYAYIFQRY